RPPRQHTVGGEARLASGHDYFCFRMRFGSGPVGTERRFPTVMNHSMWMSRPSAGTGPVGPAEAVLEQIGRLPEAELAPVGGQRRTLPRRGTGGAGAAPAGSRPGGAPSVSVAVPAAPRWAACPVPPA